MLTPAERIGLAAAVAAVITLGIVTGLTLGRLPIALTADAAPTSTFSPAPTPTPMSPATSAPTTAPTPSAEPMPVPDPTPSVIAVPATPIPVPLASVEPGTPVSAAVEENGIRVVLALDTDRTAFGHRVWADVTVTNLGFDNVYWGHSGTCAFGAGIGLHSPVPDQAWGREDWSGDSASLKSVAVQQQAPYGAFVPARSVDSGQMHGCTSDFVLSELPPGGQLGHRGAWDGIGPQGMPPAPGSYTVVASFGYHGRGFASPSFDTVPVGTISVELPLTVIGPDVAYLSPGEVVDRVLADPRFDAAFAEAPRQRWGRVDLAFITDRWTLQLDLERPAESLIATVDAVTGDVLSVDMVRSEPRSHQTDLVASSFAPDDILDSAETVRHSVMP